MEKMKLLPFMLFAVCALVFTSCDKDDDDYWPNDAIQNTLRSEYPDATRIEWERKGNYHVAECRIDGRDADVWITDNAEWVMTEKEITRNDLPAAINTAFAASSYVNWRFDDVDLLEYPVKQTLYVIEVEQGNREIQLFYSVTGELMEERDVTNRDDNHWP